jgi:hypothetical protein
MEWTPHGDQAAGLRVIARGSEDQVGRAEDGCEKLSSGCAIYTTARPFRLGSFLMKYLRQSYRRAMDCDGEQHMHSK